MSLDMLLLGDKQFSFNKSGEPHNTTTIELCPIQCFFTAQGGALQGVNALALTEPPDANRAKYVPTSARHFHSTQVMTEHDALDAQGNLGHVRYCNSLVVVTGTNVYCQGCLSCAVWADLTL